MKNILIALLLLASTAFGIEMTNFPHATPTTGTWLFGTPGYGADQYSIGDILSLVPSTVTTDLTNLPSASYSPGLSVVATPGYGAYLVPLDQILSLISVSGSNYFLINPTFAATAITNRYLIFTNYYGVYGGGPGSATNELFLLWTPSDILCGWAWKQSNGKVIDLTYWPNHNNNNSGTNTALLGPELVWGGSPGCSIALCSSWVQHGLEGQFMYEYYQRFDTAIKENPKLCGSVPLAWSCWSDINQTNYSGSMDPAGNWLPTMLPTGVNTNGTFGWRFYTRGNWNYGDPYYGYVSNEVVRISVGPDDGLSVWGHGLRLCQNTNVGYLNPPTPSYIGTNNGVFWPSNTYVYWCYSADGVTSNSPVKIAP